MEFGHAGVANQGGEDASLGSMLSDSQTYLLSAPWYALCTGGTMVLLILGFSMLGEGISQSGRRK